MKKLMSTLAVIGMLFGIGMPKEVHADCVNESVMCEEMHDHPENFREYFYCEDCDLYYGHYCENCGKDKDLWDMYYSADGYITTNYCEDCDTCYYKYCECVRHDDDNNIQPGCDYEQFVYDYTQGNIAVSEEDCEHIKSLSFDDENTDAYLDEFYMDLYMDYYTYTNHCEECDWDYYEYCECDYGQRFDDEYYEERAQNLCDDYLAFVNDYVDYESNCTEYCESCDKYYYDHCCDEYCDFNVYYMDLQYLEMIQEESIDL